MIRGSSRANLPNRGLLFAVTLLLMVAAPLPNGASEGHPYFGVDYYEFEVYQTIAHDDSAFTQGLAIHDGRMYESTGMYGLSELREIDMETGEVLRSISLNESEFGEGLAVVGDELIQLTWKAGVAHRYSIETFEMVGNFTYEGEGWGLCATGELLYMSNGTSTLTLRNSTDFSVVGELNVTLDGEPLDRLNELECIGGEMIYANVWHDDSIYIISRESGAVWAVVDCSSLFPEEAKPSHVLNGIAFMPGHNTTLYITGKYWPVMYEGGLREVTEEPNGSSTPIDDDDEVATTLPPYQILFIGLFAAVFAYLLWGKGFDTLTKSRGVHNPPDGTDGSEGEE
jgi:glutaminyl-peptide cyclotransferase